jgi:hypothetical protein
MVARTCAEQQRKWFSPPADERYGAMWEAALVKRRIDRLVRAAVCSMVSYQIIRFGSPVLETARAIHALA